jgi:hypothetical protein
MGEEISANCDLCGYFIQSILSCRAQHFIRRLPLRNSGDPDVI